VEKGRRKLSEGTILNFARALNLPTTVTDPLFGNVLLPFEEDSKTDDIVSALLKDADDLKNKLKLSEALAIALAYKYADGNPTDINGALQGLEAALSLAAEEQDRGRLPSNYEDAVNNIVAQVNALNDAGEVDEAYADLKEEAARRKGARELQVAEDGRVLELLISQATMTNDADGFAEAHLERIKLDGLSAEETFERLYAVFVEQYEDGLRFGTPSSLARATGLGRKCEMIAPNSYLRGMILSDHATVLQIEGSRTSGAKRDELMANSVHKYQEALLLRTEVEYPLEWGMTMQNLANTLAHQGIGTSGSAGVELLEDSVKGYRSALRVRTETQYPIEWAMTMQNLGNALRNQGVCTPGREGGLLLSEAADRYSEVSRVLSEANHPVEWAMVEFNMAMVEGTWAEHDSTRNPTRHLELALSHVENALRVYDPQHLGYYYGKAASLRDQILSLLHSSSSREQYR
jgi:hypothetical protein